MNQGAIHDEDLNDYGHDELERNRQAAIHGAPPVHQGDPEKSGCRKPLAGAQKSTNSKIEKEFKEKL
jgi:hypothetical protein